VFHYEKEVKCQFGRSGSFLSFPLIFICLWLKYEGVACMLTLYLLLICIYRFKSTMRFALITI